MTCLKCKGLMIQELRPDYSTESAVFRCINCGLLLDPLIQQNRLLRVGRKPPALDAA